MFRSAGKRRKDAPDQVPKSDDTSDHFFDTRFEAKADRGSPTNPQAAPKLRSLGMKRITAHSDIYFAELETCGVVDRVRHGDIVVVRCRLRHMPPLLQPLTSQSISVVALDGTFLSSRMPGGRLDVSQARFSKLVASNCQCAPPSYLRPTTSKWQEVTMRLRPASLLHGGETIVYLQVVCDSNGASSWTPLSPLIPVHVYCDKFDKDIFSMELEAARQAFAEELSETKVELETVAENFADQCSAEQKQCSELTAAHDTLLSSEAHARQAQQSLLARLLQLEAEHDGCRKIREACTLLSESEAQALETAEARFVELEAEQSKYRALTVAHGALHAEEAQAREAAETLSTQFDLEQDRCKELSAAQVTLSESEAQALRMAEARLVELEAETSKYEELIASYEHLSREEARVREAAEAHISELEAELRGRELLEMRADEAQASETAEEHFDELEAEQSRYRELVAAYDISREGEAHAQESAAAYSAELEIERNGHMSLEAEQSRYRELVDAYDILCKGEASAEEIAATRSAELEVEQNGRRSLEAEHVLLSEGEAHALAIAETRLAELEAEQGRCRELAALESNAEHVSTPEAIPIPDEPREKSVEELLSDVARVDPSKLRAAASKMPDVATQICLDLLLAVDQSALSKASARRPMLVALATMSILDSVDPPAFVEAAAARPEVAASATMSLLESMDPEILAKSAATGANSKTVASAAISLLDSMHASALAEASMERPKVSASAAVSLLNSLDPLALKDAAATMTDSKMAASAAMTLLESVESSALMDVASTRSEVAASATMSFLDSIDPLTFAKTAASRQVSKSAASAAVTLLDSVASSTLADATAAMPKVAASATMSLLESVDSSALLEAAASRPKITASAVFSLLDSVDPLTLREVAETRSNSQFAAASAAMSLLDSASLPAIADAVTTKPRLAASAGISLLTSVNPLALMEAAASMPSPGIAASTAISLLDSLDPLAVMKAATAKPKVAAHAAMSMMSGDGVVQAAAQIAPELASLATTDRFSSFLSSLTEKAKFFIPRTTTVVADETPVDMVQFAAFAPQRLQPASVFELSIRAFTEAFREVVRTEEKERHGNEEANLAMCGMPISIYAEVRVSLQMPTHFSVVRKGQGFIDDPSGQDLPTKSFIWCGKKSDPLLFEVAIDENVPCKAHKGIALISTDNGATKACLQFELRIEQDQAAEESDSTDGRLSGRLSTKRRIIIMSSPEKGSGCPSGGAPFNVHIMDELRALQYRQTDGTLNFTMAFDRAGSSTAHDLDAERGQWYLGNESDIKETHWFYGYKSRVKACAFVECQNFDGVVEVVCIHGGPITQVEQKEMPSIIRDARFDAGKSGVRCAIDIRYVNYHSLRSHLVEGIALQDSIAPFTVPLESVRKKKHISKEAETRDPELALVEDDKSLLPARAGGTKKSMCPRFCCPRRQG
eukprot:TRINITY_DN30241_c0_g1_i1.p1 TRINITY_DN30241_c0_g1~~TRINITY_DN30241_c0_g1_i1.p1  ORF type:complete len:1440 (+),score=237.39 TRINITY_DN30241_c0_g1_i1:90-4409(+)